MSSITLKVRIPSADEVRRVTLEQPSFEAFTAQLDAMFGAGALARFRAKYEDDEGDLVTIACEADWREALTQLHERSGARPMLRLQLDPAVEEPAQPQRRHHHHHRRRRCHSGARHQHHRQQHKQESDADDAAESSHQCPMERAMRQARAELNRAMGGAAAANPLAGLGAMLSPMLGPLIGAGLASPAGLGRLGLGALAGGAGQLEQVRKVAEQMLGQAEPKLRQALDKLLSGQHVKVEHAALCDGCDQRISGVRFRCLDCDDFDFCEACHQARAHSEHDAAHSFKRISPLEALREHVQRQGVAGVDAFVAPGAANAAPKHPALCDACDATIVGVRHKCQQCPDFDLCTNCLESDNVVRGDHTPAHTFCHMTHPAQRFTPAAAPAAADAKAKQEQHAEAEAEEEPEEEVVVVHEEEQQPEPVEQHQVEDVQVEQPKPQQAEPAVAPAAQPQQPADKEEAAAAAAEQPEPAKPKLTPFEMNLQTLNDMGFTDRHANITALVRHKGQLFPALQELLRQ